MSAAVNSVTKATSTTAVTKKIATKVAESKVASGNQVVSRKPPIAAADAAASRSSSIQANTPS